jgi:hypothetical protein
MTSMRTDGSNSNATLGSGRIETVKVLSGTGLHQELIGLPGLNPAVPRRRIGGKLAGSKPDKSEIRAIVTRTGAWQLCRA